MTLGRWVPFFCYVKDSQWRRIAMRFQGGQNLAKMKPTWKIPDILYYGTDKVLWSRSQISTIFKPWRWDYIGDLYGNHIVHASTSVHLNISYLLHPSLNTNNSYQSCPGTYSIVAQARSCGQGQRNQIFSNPGEGVYKAENFVFSPVSSLCFCCSHLFV